MNASNELVTAPDVDEAAARRSLRSDWVDEAHRFKWIESQKAGRDLGEAAIRQWVKNHWWGYLRARWLQHLQGSCFWIELKGEDFGLLCRAFQDEKDLLDRIVNQLKEGQENLGIITWAKCNNIPSDSVLRILESLDVNSVRIVHELDAQ